MTDKPAQSFDADQSQRKQEAEMASDVREKLNKQICPPDGNVHTMPTTDYSHFESVDCWCKPELVGDYESEGGVKHYLHKELQ